MLGGAAASESLTEFLQNVFKYALQRDYGEEEFDLAPPGVPDREPPRGWHAHREHPVTAAAVGTSPRTPRR